MAEKNSHDKHTAAKRQESSVGTISAERKALDLVIQASRADPKLRAAVLEVEKWIGRLTESASEAWQVVNETEEDAGRDVHYQADLRHKAETELDGLRQEYDTRCRERDAAERERDQLREAICDYVDAYEDGDGERAGHLYGRLYEIGTEDKN